jgi:hypothetical protein
MATIVQILLSLQSRVNLPSDPNTVIPEAILIGNPASNRLKLWIPDKDIRG